MIRLSEAYARLGLETYITEKHVREAYRLLSVSIIKLEKGLVVIEGHEIEEKDMDNVSEKLSNMKLI